MDPPLGLHLASGARPAVAARRIAAELSDAPSCAVRPDERRVCQKECDVGEAFEKPRWVRDFLRFLPLKSQFVLSGNVRDRFPRLGSEGELTILPLVAYLGAELVEAGIERVIAYDPARGFRLP